MAVDDLGSLSSKKPDQAHRLLHRFESEEALHRKGVHRDAGTLVSRQQRSAVPNADDRDGKFAPVEALRGSKCVQLRAAYLHVVYTVHDPNGVIRRSDGQACLGEGMLFDMDD
jgi:hypothetical protein